MVATVAVLDAWICGTARLDAARRFSAARRLGTAGRFRSRTGRIEMLMTKASVNGRRIHSDHNKRESDHKAARENARHEKPPRLERGVKGGMEMFFRNPVPKLWHTRLKSQNNLCGHSMPEGRKSLENRDFCLFKNIRGRFERLGGSVTSQNL